MNTRLFPTALVGAALLGLFASGVHAQGNDLNLGAVQPPNLGWGQRGQFTVLVSQGGRPAKAGVPVQFWFSGQKGIKTLPFTLRSNREGRVTFTRNLPQLALRLGRSKRFLRSDRGTKALESQKIKEATS